MNTIPILYENTEIIVLNKPAGLAVQGGVGIAHSLDVDLPKQVGYKIYLVHRLDKDTAGLMIVAKTPAAAAKWIKLIGCKQVQKEYEAICIGTPSGGKKGVIADAVVQGGVEKSALTRYEVKMSQQVVLPPDAEGNEKKCQLSLIHVVLGTGRMHQIRIHMAKRGCPIAGDDKHGNFKMNKLLRKARGIKSLLLASVSLTIPLDGKIKQFTIPLPEHMQSVCVDFT
ncbi:MAG: RluA family pseudouridine synthase [Treponema sp.]|nr:RluA family pseudouridine synthase [Treponema sp.]